MKEIKFRAWDKENKKMVYSGTDDFWFMSFDNESIGILGCHNIGGDPDTTIDSFELMQFVGLTDKNGKKIYEGDIVSSSNKGIKKVFWSKLDCQFAIDGTYLYRMADIEIIGNIYENPELLN